MRPGTAMEGSYVIPLKIVLDDWAQPPDPEPAQFPDQFQRRLQLDAMLSARIQAPGPLVLVTGI